MSIMADSVVIDDCSSKGRQKITLIFNFGNWDYIQDSPVTQQYKLDIFLWFIETGI